MILEHAIIQFPPKLKNKSEQSVNIDGKPSTQTHDSSMFIKPFAQIIITELDLDLYSTDKYSINKFSQILNKLNVDNSECVTIYRIIIDFCKKENCTLLEYYISNEVKPNFSVKSILESIERKLFQLSVTRFKDLVV